MFEVNGRYSNRIGDYTVLEMGPEKMKVRYDSGDEAELKIAIQERIWQNLLADKEASAPRVRKPRVPGSQNRFYLKSIPAVSEEDLTATGIRNLTAPADIDAPPIDIGDRFIYYAADSQNFFAVATITGEPKSVSVSDYADMGFKGSTVNVYPLDLDAATSTLSAAVAADSVELDSQPGFKELLQKGGVYLTISEDDFEMLAELLTELSEEDEEEDEDEEDEEEEEDLLDDLDLDV